MKILKISPNIYKVESWLFFKMSAWIVTVKEGVYIVDTGMAFMGKRILKEAEKLGEVKGVLLTHGHSDHVGGLKKILEGNKVPVFAGQLRKPMAMFTADMEETVKSGRVVEELKPNVVSICHGNDVKEPHNQIKNYLALYS